MVLIGALSWGLYTVASRIDAEAKAREELLVSNGLELHEDEIARSMEANTIWDDAVKHLDARFDPAWARDYIGQYFWHSDGYQLVYVLDGRDRPEFAYNRGRVADASTFAPLAAAAAPMMDRIRARERLRGPVATEGPEPSPGIGATTVARSGGQAYFLAASLVQTDHSGNVRPSNPAPVVVVAEAIDGAFLAKLSRSYLLDDLRLISLTGPALAGEARAPIRDAMGGPVAWIAWKPSSPISHLVRVAGPPLALAFLTLVGVAAVLLRHERRRADALARATRAAQTASEAKSAFLATMSHEIRTPLNGVLGMAQALAKEPLDPSQRVKLDVVRQSGETLLAILNDVLDLAKIEAGRLELELIEFDLAEVVDGARSAFVALVGEKAIAFRLEMPDAQGIYLGDPTRIRQILYNLVSNAVKFTDSGEIRVAAEATDLGLKLSVADTGTGIEPDKLTALFDKFTQADTSTTRRFGGTGLGLAVCRDLAHLMGGSIEATSEPGIGSEFVVSLPVKRLSDAHRGVASLRVPSVDATPAFGTDLASARVLVAEDNPTNQLVIKTLLGQVDVEPTIVENGERAVEAWEAGDFDLILMDVQMPVMDGLDAARTIRSRERANGRSRTPIVALTADAMSHQVAQHLAAGMDGHLAKPIEAAALLEVVCQHLALADRNAQTPGAAGAVAV